MICRLDRGLCLCRLDLGLSLVGQFFSQILYKIAYFLAQQPRCVFVRDDRRSGEGEIVELRIDPVMEHGSAGPFLYGGFNVRARVGLAGVFRAAAASAMRVRSAKRGVCLITFPLRRQVN